MQLSSIVDPTANDSSYVLGTLWINSNTEFTFIIVDNTHTSSVWVKLGKADDLGDVSTLTTVATNAVDAINELDSEIGDLSALTTTDKASTVNAINELDSEIGDIATLTTTDKASVVNAINEVNAKEIPQPDDYYRGNEFGIWI